MKIHIVQKGDTLWEIAKKYGVNFEELKQVNPQLASPDMIMPGMKIKVPSSTKQVKKEAPIKEKQKEMPKPTAPKHPIVKEDEKEKQQIIQPEKPLPQMPVYPMMQMPAIEQEMQNYTMINLPPMQAMPQMEMPHHEKAKEPVKEKKEEMTLDTKQHVAPQMPQHLHTPPAPQELPTVHQHQCEEAPPMQMPAQAPCTHMYPVCCHVLAPCYPVMPPHGFEGAMGGHHPMPMPMPEPMPMHPPFNSGDCGCGGGGSFVRPEQEEYYAPSLEDSMMADYQNFADVPSEQLQEGFHNPRQFENNFGQGLVNSYPPIPPQNATDFYPTPPSFIEEEEEE